MIPQTILSRAADLYDTHLRDWLGSFVLLPLCVYFAVSRGDYTLVDSADLVIHEAGHLFLQPFGRFLAYAGGTLMQIALPTLIAWHFWWHGYRFGMQVGMLWLGQNLINISVYAADARSRSLPLLGGDIGQHDWWNMLGMLGMLEFDQAIGVLFYVAAIVVFIALLLVPLRMWG